MAQDTNTGRVAPSDVKGTGLADVDARIPSSTLAAAGIDQSVNIAAPLDIFSREQLLTMISLVREPPRMPVSGVADGAVGIVADPTIRAEAEKLSAAPTFDTAYRIGSLLVRRQADVEQSDDAGAKRGIDELGEQLRMFEHLHLMRTNPA